MAVQKIEMLKDFHDTKAGDKVDADSKAMAKLGLKAGEDYRVVGTYPGPRPNVLDADESGKPTRRDVPSPGRDRQVTPDRDRGIKSPPSRPVPTPAPTPAPTPTPEKEKKTS